MQAYCAKSIHDLGYKLILTDMNPDCFCRDMAYIFIERDTFDIPGNMSEISKLKRVVDINAVLTVAADCHETVAVLAAELGLPGVDPNLSRLCRYKQQSRDALFRQGIRQPRFQAVSTVADARSFAASIDGPLVVKATDNSGSRGFSCVQSADEIDNDIFNRALENGTTGKVVVEECIIPLDNEIAEQSVETLWIDGTMYWLNWVDRLFRKDFIHFRSLDRSIYDNVSWGVEIGHINQAVHSLKTKQSVKQLIWQAGNAIGMQNQTGAHFLKADIMLTESGPMILELTPRLSGGWDSSKSTVIRGADFIGAAIQMAIGSDIDLKFWNKYFNYQDASLYAAVFAQIRPAARDCIGREFALGTGYERTIAVTRALTNLKENKYVLPLE